MTRTFSWDGLRTSLARRKNSAPDAPSSSESREAAVAVLLRRREPTGLEVLFIRRAEHPEDPWSGHMAFPGGRVDSEDAGPLDAALRETHEEIGLDLQRRAPELGKLPAIPVIGRGRRLPMVIHPFVFAVPPSDVELSLNYEVEEALWIPARLLGDRARRGAFLWRNGRTPARIYMPCLDHRGRRIWGLTLRMVDDLVEVIAGTDR
ncbi:MAG: CoA pyrophosphatase [Thermoanaerobaculia bacterium]|nr:CoA pyrophosphatase [Thermoanaerobaculia bacterium]